jgi:hypothetical protein
MSHFGYNILVYQYTPISANFCEHISVHVLVAVTENCALHVVLIKGKLHVR